MRTQLFISPNRKGTVSITAGSNLVSSSGTSFTADDELKKIVFRTTTGDVEATIQTVNLFNNSLILTENLNVTQSNVFFYLEYIEVDLYDDIPFTLTYNIADIRNPDKRNGSFSKTIRIPGSDLNNDILGNIFEIDIDGSYNPNIKALAYIDIDTIEQFRGVMQLLQINRTRDFIEYEIAIFGSIGTLFNGIGNKQLRDIDLSAYNHQVTLTNISNSWATSIIKNGVAYDNFTGTATTQFPNGQPIGEGYTYPLIYDGYALPTSNSFKFEMPTIRGGVYAKQIIDSIISSVGYNYTSNFLNTNYFKKLVVPFQRRAKHKVLAQLSIDVQRNFQTPAAFPVFCGGKIMIWRYNFASNNFTEITSVDVPVSDNDTEVVTYTLSTDVELEYGDWLYVEANCIGYLNTQSSTNPFPPVTDIAQLLLSNGTFTITYDTSTNVTDVNNSMQVFCTSDVIDSPSTTGTNEVVEFDTIVYDPYNTWFAAGNYHIAPYTNLQSNFHDNIKQIDFLMSIVKMFNLYIDVDKDDYQNLIIEPYNDFMGTDVLDWTMKLDHSRQIEIYPMGELNFKQFLCTYKSDSDVANVAYTARWAEMYGQYIKNIDNDFVQQQQKVELIFSPTHGISSNAGIVISQHYKGNSNKPEPFAQNIRILFHNGIIDLTSSLAKIGFWNSFTDAVVTIGYTYYAQFLHLDDAQNPSADLLFGLPRQVFWDFDNPEVYTSNNLYNGYWDKYISEITDKDSKIVKMWLYLTVQDIRQLDFSKKYFINNSYYRLNKVENYNPIKEQVTKCEFLKISEGTPFVAGVTENPIGNIVNYNVVTGGQDEVRNLSADSFYNIASGGQDEVRSLSATSPIHIIKG